MKNILFTLAILISFASFGQIEEGITYQAVINNPNGEELPVVDNPCSPLTNQDIETQIDGDFEGWEGETIFKMTNGQIWQQSSYSYMYHYAYMPNVIIYDTSSGYVLKVEGVEETIYVTQL